MRGPAEGRARRLFGGRAGALGDLAVSPFRADRDRIVCSPFFARLGGVTQVISPGGSGLLVHNRLTHSLKVAQVARAIAERLIAGPYAGAAGQARRLRPGRGGGRRAGPRPRAIRPSGTSGSGCWTGWPASRLGLPDGFEGNAQSYRIVTSTEIRGAATTGLDLTAAVRAAMLKYPWTPAGLPRPAPPAARPGAARRAPRRRTSRRAGR